jgi:hypothetical protein
MAAGVSVGVTAVLSLSETTFARDGRGGGRGRRVGNSRSVNIKRSDNSRIG